MSNVVWLDEQAMRVALGLVETPVAKEARPRSYVLDKTIIEYSVRAPWGGPIAKVRLVVPAMPGEVARGQAEAEIRRMGLVPWVWLDMYVESREIEV